MKTFPLVPTLVSLLLAALCGAVAAEEEIRPAYRFQAGDVHVFTGEANAKVAVKFGGTEKERETRFKMETRAFLLSFERGGTRLGVKERAEKLMEKGSEIQTRWTLGHLDNQGTWKPDEAFARADRKIITGKNVLAPLRFPDEALRPGMTWKSPFSGLNLLDAPMVPLEVECTLVSLEGEGADREALIRINLECLEPELIMPGGDPHPLRVKTQETSEIAFRFHLEKGRVTRYSMRLVFTMSGQGMEAKGDLTLELGLDSVDGGETGPHWAEAVSKALAVADAGDAEKGRGILMGRVEEDGASPWAEFGKRLLEADRFRGGEDPGEKKAD